MADPTQPDEPAVGARADMPMPPEPTEPSPAPSGPPCLRLYGVIGDEWDCCDAGTVAEWIAQNAGASEIQVRINSGGGFVGDGLAIYNLIASFPGKKTVCVDGIAASMASVIAMAGSERLMGDGAILMLHQPWNVTIGNSVDHRKSADTLDVIGEQLARIYSKVSGQKLADVTGMMNAETWLGADDCVKMGFATGMAQETADDKALASVRLDHLGLSHALPARLLAARERHPELVPAARAAGAVRPRTLAAGEMLAEADPPTPTLTITASTVRRLDALAERLDAITAAPAVDEPAAAPGPESEAAAPAVAEVNAENPMTTAEASAAKNAEILAAAAHAAASTSEMDGLKAQLASLRDEAEQTKKANAALKAERDEDKRQIEIRRMGAQAKLGELAETMAVDKDVTVAMAKDKLFDALALKQEAEQGKPTGSHVRVEGGADAGDKWMAGATAWLITRSEARVKNAVLAAAKAKGETVDLDPGEFRGMRLLDLARDAVEMSGRRARGMDPRKLVGAAFTMRPQGAIVQGTPDFPTLLENTMHKVMQAAYGTTPDTWRRFCNIGTVTDFRAHNRYRTGSFGTLDLVMENGEYKYKSVPDGEKAQITALTKGNLYALSRQVIINDDMNALTGVAAAAGRAAKLSVEVDVYSTLGLNSGHGPNLADGNPLFHTSRSNIGSTGAPSVTTFDEVRQLMGKQKDVTGNEILDLRPTVWVGPATYGMTARIVNEAQYDPSTSNKFQVPNGVRGIFSDIVDTARLTSTIWYAFADAAAAPTLEVAFLDGMQEPFLDNETGWSIDGVEWKVRLDYGIAAIDYRGAVVNG